MLIAAGNDLNPRMVVRWKAFLTQIPMTRDPALLAWHRFAELSDAEFAAKAPAVAAGLGQGGVNAVVARAFREPPKAMADVATRYADVLSGAQARTIGPLLAGGSAFAIADPAEADV